MQIRLFKEKDADEVSKLVRKTLLMSNSKDYPECVINFLHQSYAPELFIQISKNYHIFVLEKRNHIIGTISVEEDKICNLFVESSLQGKGYGKKLLKKAEKVIKKTNYERSRLFASLTALKFYEKQGYKVIRIDHDIHRGMTHEMVKKM